MANTYKNIVVTPNIGSAVDDPKIVFSGGNATVNTDITLKTYPTSNGTISFEGSAGQLFSITNDLTGTIFSVNDVSGIPSIEVLDTGLIKFAQYGGNILVGTGTDNAVDKLQVVGGLSLVGALKANTVSLAQVDATSNTFTTASTTQISIDAWPIATYRSAKYFVQITSGSAYHIIELNLVHNGTTVFLAQYGEVLTGSSLGTFDADISGATVRLLFTGVNAVSTIKVLRTVIDV